ncbi:hypothetical protein KIPB_009072 [Kipferlia bialata]|uniref:Uncharacterized protein n=1 Tax=Kipferlia bialata TaxID=797122 RepID=A0A9K3GLB0_9EUKA|nr:hypothetical protein KIPB_009072 [Kipferlia bialata]|eukprot:g9072.t1
MAFHDGEFTVVQFTDTHLDWFLDPRHNPSLEHLAFMGMPLFRVMQISARLLHLREVTGGAWVHRPTKRSKKGTVVCASCQECEIKYTLLEGYSGSIIRLDTFNRKTVKRVPHLYCTHSQECTLNPCSKYDVFARPLQCKRLNDMYAPVSLGHNMLLWVSSNTTAKIRRDYYASRSGCNAQTIDLLSTVYVTELPTTDERHAGERERTAVVNDRCTDS